jgi:hypothetical protein
MLGAQRAATSPCAAQGNRQPLKLPALFLSDADGAYGTSWASYPDISTATEWSSDMTDSVSCSSGTQPVLADLNMSMVPNMVDGTSGSPGYRTILSFFGTISPTNSTFSRSLLISLGHRQRETLSAIALPDLSTVRLRLWWGQSSQGYSFEIRCAQAPPPLPAAAAQTPEQFTGSFDRQTFVALSTRAWMGTVTCPTFRDTSSPSGVVVSNVEFDLSNNPQATLSVLVGAAARRTITPNSTTGIAMTFVNATWLLGGSTDPVDVGWPSYLVYSGALHNIASIVTDGVLPVNVTVTYRCVFVHRPFVPSGSATNGVGPLRYPAVILSDADGPLGNSWMSYADHAPSSSWSSLLAGPSDDAVPHSFGCDATAGEYPELTYMNISIVPSMQDTTWHSPGYRTIISFLDARRAVLVAFGNNATQTAANVSER